MSTPILLRPSSQTIRRLDVIMGCWVALWLTVGIWTGYDLYQLSGLAGSVQRSGHALQTIGQTVGGLGKLPFIGSATSSAAHQINTVAQDIITQSANDQAVTRQLAILLGLAVGLVPLAPVLGVYLPLRLRRRRQVEAVQQALARDRDDPAIRELLAYQAAQNLPLDDLLAVTRTPWRDLAGGRFDALADAELTRLGVGQSSTTPPERVPPAPDS